MSTKAVIGYLDPNGNVLWVHYFGNSSIPELGRLLMNNFKESTTVRKHLLSRDISSFYEKEDSSLEIHHKQPRKDARVSKLKAMPEKGNVIYIFSSASKKWFVFDWKINRFISLFSYLLEN